MTDYARSFPAVSNSDDWTEGVVTQGHYDFCRNNGHATWTVDGATMPTCPRCGEWTVPHIVNPVAVIPACRVLPRDFVEVTSGLGRSLAEVARVDRSVGGRARIYFRDADRRPVDLGEDEPMHIVDRAMAFTCITCGDAFPNYPTAFDHCKSEDHAVVHAKSRYALQLERAAHYTLDD